MLVHPELSGRVGRIVAATPVCDVHTHLYDTGFGSLLKSGIDELLIYHYLVSESFRQGCQDYDRFWSATSTEQADWIWSRIFRENSPLSEAARGVVTTLHALGIEPRSGDLSSLRQWFASRSREAHLEAVLEAAGVSRVCMTNSPFDAEETPYWAQAPRRDPRFLAALRIDPLLLDWAQARRVLVDQGYTPTGPRDEVTAREVRRFLADWTRRLDARYCMVSVPPEFAYPGSSDLAWMLDHAVLPHCGEHGQGFALMMGVRRGVNPRLRMAGDGVGRSEMGALSALCDGHPQHRFLVTCLSRENQHELVVLARKFPNLHPFGCWWFTNTPQLADEITTMRLELLGPSFTAQHSDARVLEQLIYKWTHTREVVARCLARAYGRLEATGWSVADTEIARDVQSLFGGSWDRFLSGVESTYRGPGQTASSGRLE